MSTVLNWIYVINQPMPTDDLVKIKSVKKYKILGFNYRTDTVINYERMTKVHQELLNAAFDTKGFQV